MGACFSSSSDIQYVVPECQACRKLGSRVWRSMPPQERRFWEVVHDGPSPAPRTTRQASGAGRNGGGRSSISSGGGGGVAGGKGGKGGGAFLCRKCYVQREMRERHSRAQERASLVRRISSGLAQRFSSGRLKKIQSGEQWEGTGSFMRAHRPSRRVQDLEHELQQWAEAEATMVSEVEEAPSPGGGRGVASDSDDDDHVGRGGGGDGEPRAPVGQRGGGSSSASPG